MEKKTLDELMEQGYQEVLELGFEKQGIVYAKGKERIIYNTLTEEIRVRYYSETKYKPKSEYILKLK